MSRAAQKLISASGGKAYEIDQSLMFADADSPKLRRTPSSEGNRKTFTFSTWCKRSSLADWHTLFGAYVSVGSPDDSHYFYFGFTDGDALRVTGWSTAWRITNRLFRDVGAWYHLVLQFDTTQGTADNRVKIYVNGVQETSFSTSNNPSENYDVAINNTVAQAIGETAYDAGSGPFQFDGYMAETHLFDGAVVAPSEFGETDSETGQWIPKKYVGSSSYGTNGYYMPWKKNDRYSTYFDGSTSTGITTPDHSDFTLGTNNFTIEAWVYRDEDAGNTGYICGNSQADGANSSAGVPALYIDTNNKPHAIIFTTNGASYFELISSTAVNDNKWYHVALVRNSNTFSLYLNGTSVASNTTAHTMADSSNKMGVGVLGEYTANHFKGWISNFRLVNGTAVYTSNFTPSTSPLTAVTNTVLLCCQDKTVTTDNSGTSKTLTVTAANTYTQQMSPFTYDWYQDQSGQDNHYQPDNLTVNDVMLDSPTNNFCTMNPLIVTGADGITFKQGALRPVSGGAFAKSLSTFAPDSGKWYCEYHVDATASNFGGVGATTLNDLSQSHIGYSTGETHWVLNHSTAAYQTVYKDNVATGASSLGNVAVGDIVGLSLDADAGKIYFRKNNSVIGTSTGYAITSDTMTGVYWFVAYLRSQSSYGYGTFNFGQNGTFCGQKTAQGNTDANGIGDFYYSPPSGYIALCAKNLPTPAIKDPSAHFQTTLYAGDSNNSTVITNSGNSDLQPDLIWIKNRTHGTTTGVGANMFFDSVRGIKSTTGSDSPFLVSNLANDEETNTNALQAVSSDGFTPGSMTRTNETGDNLVAWQWKAGGGAGSSNTDGTINTTSTSVNTTAGISISTYTGTGSNATVGHGLGVAPSVIIVKSRSEDESWMVQTIGDATDYMNLETTAASADWHGIWNDTAATSSVFSIGDGDGVNKSSATYVAYCFADVSGFSKSGWYRGNSNAVGPMIYTGFTPAWIMIKMRSIAITGGGDWLVRDIARDPTNPSDSALYANLHAAESTTSLIVDILSNGFKIRSNHDDHNDQTETLWWMAFASTPFKYANAR